MPSYVFKGTDERYYTDLGLEAKPGDVVTLDKALDDLWELVDGQVVAPEPIVQDAVKDKPAPAKAAVKDDVKDTKAK